MSEAMGWIEFVRSSSVDGCFFHALYMVKNNMEGWPMKENTIVRNFAVKHTFGDEERIIRLFTLSQKRKKQKSLLKEFPKNMGQE